MKGKTGLRTDPLAADLEVALALRVAVIFTIGILQRIVTFDWLEYKESLINHIQLHRLC